MWEPCSAASGSLLIVPQPKGGMHQQPVPHAGLGQEYLTSLYFNWTAHVLHLMYCRWPAEAVVGAADGSLSTWSFATAAKLQPLGLRLQGRVTCLVACRAVIHTCMAAAADGSITHVDVHAGCVLQRWHAHGGAVQSMQLFGDALLQPALMQALNRQAWESTLTVQAASMQGADIPKNEAGNAATAVPQPVQAAAAVGSAQGRHDIVDNAGKQEGASYVFETHESGAADNSNAAAPKAGPVESLGNFEAPSAQSRDRSLAAAHERFMLTAGSDGAVKVGIRWWVLSYQVQHLSRLAVMAVRDASTSGMHCVAGFRV